MQREVFMNRIAADVVLGENVRIIAFVKNKIDVIIWPACFLVSSYQ